MSRTIHTIGHSVAPVEKLIELLRGAEIATLADVRSVPYSRRVPQANRENLKRTIQRAGLSYVYLGEQLGGKIDDPNLKTPDGKTDYQLVRKSDRFRAGIDVLVELAATTSTCILCAEENPAHCHRAALIAPALVERGCQVIHLRHDGSRQSHADIEHRRTQGQLELF